MLTTTPESAPSPNLGSFTSINLNQQVASKARHFPENKLPPKSPLAFRVAPANFRAHARTGQRIAIAHQGAGFSAPFGFHAGALGHRPRGDVFQQPDRFRRRVRPAPVSYTHLRAHETGRNL